MAPLEKSMTGSDSIDREAAVRSRYSQAASEKEQALCCPVNYDTRYLKILPDEILERDYGCGDPSGFVQPGETVLDLGSGGGKLCYIAAQIVGQQGKIIGVDCNTEMLALARKYQQPIADTLGFCNVEFRCGRIQDLSLNLELLADELENRELDSVDRLLEMRALESRLRKEQPLVESDSIDCVLSNCVLNLIDPADRVQLFSEIHRVLKVGGRAAIADIVSDEDIPESMRNDETLWSGCISGAWREDQFVEEFRKAGFGGIEIAKRQNVPWKTVNGIEFRPMTVVARKMDPGKCLERNQAVIYRGPFQEVTDDDGQVYRRGVRTAVCDKTFRTLRKPPYGPSFIPIQPAELVSLENAAEFDCTTTKLRHPSETKGGSPPESDNGCCGDSSCC